MFSNSETLFDTGKRVVEIDTQLSLQTNFQRWTILEMYNCELVVPFTAM